MNKKNLGTPKLYVFNMLILVKLNVLEAYGHGGRYFNKNNYFKGVCGHLVRYSLKKQANWNYIRRIKEPMSVISL